MLGMTAVGDTKEGLERFTQALLEIDRSLSAMNKQRVWRELPRTRLCAKSSDVLHKKRGKFCGWKESIGKISMEYAYLYPPGIPIIVPGEQITEDVIAYLEMYEQLGYSIEGLEVDKDVYKRQSYIRSKQSIVETETMIRHQVQKQVLILAKNHKVILRLLQ